jgi:hypothetical protein
MSVIPVQACKLIMAPSCNVIRIFLIFIYGGFFHMSKGLSLWFAVSSIVLLTASAISISYNGFLAVGLALLSILNIGWGFIIKSKRRPS